MLPLITLVAGGDAGAREAAIAERAAACTSRSETVAIILEGMPKNPGHFDSNLRVIRLAPGCPCCTGNLAMRVTLNRILQRPPSRLYVSIADTVHLKSLRNFLTQPPYDTLTTLDNDLLI